MNFSEDREQYSLDHQLKDDSGILNQQQVQSSSMNLSGHWGKKLSWHHISWILQNQQYFLNQRLNDNSGTQNQPHVQNSSTNLLGDQGKKWGSHYQV